jgi:hypothetical protein
VEAVNLSNVGKEYYVAFWLTGHEGNDKLRAYAHETDEVFQRVSDHDRVNLGPAQWSLLRPGEDERVPEVPKHIEAEINEKGRRTVIVEIVEGEPLKAQAPAMLVCWRKGVSDAPQFVKRGFVGDLTQGDLAKLRAITKRKYLEMNPEHTPLTDSEADTFIDRLGPDVAYDLIANAPTSGAVN